MGMEKEKSVAEPELFLPHEEHEKCCGAEPEMFLPPTNPVSNPQPTVTHTIYMTHRTQCPLYRTNLCWARAFICENAYRNPRKTLLGCKSEEDWRKIGGPGLMGHGRPKKISSDRLIGCSDPRC